MQAEIAKSRPAVMDARRQSEALKAETALLRRRLIETAARVQGLEQQKIWLAADISALSQEARTLSASFLHQRAQVAELLAGFERMQHDAPPAMAVRPGDALAAAHASMLLGATLPRLYGAAAELARRLSLLQHTRAETVRRRTEASRNAALLENARNDLDQLLAMKARQAEDANARYGDLAAKLDAAADQAADLETLLHRVAALRATATSRGVVVVAARNGRASRALQRQALLRPVVGRMVAGDATAEGTSHAPGISFLAPPAAQVIAPADSEVLFAGPYHKSGEVLILQSGAGYDLVLAGLDHVDVRAGDQLLAGEPVGRMPRSGTEARLYFELRENGKGVSPAPWLELEPRKVTRS
ncbi:MAG: murein hydrolase activator EnvC family protein [Rhizomicrobium sp.]